jgi:hypothetical protein
MGFMASTSSWSARRMLRILAMLGTALVGGLGLLVINPSPAQAQGTYVHRYCLETYQHPTPHGHEWVDYCYGFDSGAATMFSTCMSRLCIPAAAAQLSRNCTLTWSSGVCSTPANWSSKWICA